MSQETKILKENIKTLRHLINEGATDGDISKYIQNHEYVYIYYGGDDSNKRGYRTIRPYVLGTNKSGNQVLRAWQDRGKSADFANRPTRVDSQNHDYWNSEKGIVPGWRMFRLDKIEKIYPTGKKFNNPDGTVMIPPKYKEGSDSDMASIITYVSTKVEPEIDSKEVQPQPENRNKWDNFSNGNKNNRKITAQDIVKLRDIASRVYKKKIGNFLVGINNNNEFDLIDGKNKHKVPESAIVGSLANLYDTLVNQNKTPDDKFFKDSLTQLRNDVKPESKPSGMNYAEMSSMKENENLPTIPYKKTTFFK